MKWIVISLGLWLAALFAPLGWLWLTVPIETAQTARSAEATLIFGAIVRGGQISPLHSERLDTGVALWRDGQTDVLVVSNAARAARVMASYLEDAGVPSEAIELDTEATSTPDTCVAEAGRGTARSLHLISQAYHLPRIALQCRRLGVTGQYVAATRQAVGEGQVSLWTKLRVRGGRHTREALLIWAELLGQYRALERAVSP